MEYLGSHWADFLEIWYLSIFRKSVEKIQVSLKYDKINGYFTWRPIYISHDIFFSSSYSEKSFRQNLYRQSQNTLRANDEHRWNFKSVNTPPPPSLSTSMRFITFICKHPNVCFSWWWINCSYSNVDYRPGTGPTTSSRIDMRLQ
jgi:hypothetical protein